MSLFVYTLPRCVFDFKVAIRLSPQSAVQTQGFVCKCLTLCSCRIQSSFLFHSANQPCFQLSVFLFCDKSVRPAPPIVVALLLQGSNASWSCVSSSSTCRRWSQWEIVPASRWSSLPQSEYRDCFSCQPVQTMVGKSWALIVRWSIFTHSKP